jgi:hypothetical protein
MESLLLFVGAIIFPSEQIAGLALAHVSDLALLGRAAVDEDCNRLTRCKWPGTFTQNGEKARGVRLGTDANRLMTSPRARRCACSGVSWLGCSRFLPPGESSSDGRCSVGSSIFAQRLANMLGAETSPLCWETGGCVTGTACAPRCPGGGRWYSTFHHGTAASGRPCDSGPAFELLFPLVPLVLALIAAASSSSLSTSRVLVVPAIPKPFRARRTKEATAAPLLIATTPWLATCTWGIVDGSTAELTLASCTCRSLIPCTLLLVDESIGRR